MAHCLVSPGIQGFFYAPFDHKESSVQFTNCLPFCTVDALAAGKCIRSPIIAVSHLDSGSLPCVQRTMQHNTNKVGQAGAAVLGGLSLYGVKGWCCNFAAQWREVSVSVCFLQRVWTVAVFLVASAMQGYRHRTFTQRLKIWLVISENLSGKMMAVQGLSVTKIKMKRLKKQCCNNA